MNEINRVRMYREQMNATRGTYESLRSEMRKAHADIAVAQRKLDEAMKDLLHERIADGDDGCVVVDDIAIVQVWAYGGAFKVVEVMPAYIVADDEV